MKLNHTDTDYPLIPKVEEVVSIVDYIKACKGIRNPARTVPEMLGTLETVSWAINFGLSRELKEHKIAWEGLKQDIDRVLAKAERNRTHNTQEN